MRTDADRSDSALPSGVRVGDYVVREIIASGGFGTVYRAEHATRGVAVALKVLHAELASTSEAVLRFKREVEVVRRLHHPNVIEMLDSGQLDDGRPYFVMELLIGEDLETHVRSKRRLQPSEIMAVLEPLCAALTAAHEQGVVHRDLKASNVFLTEQRGARRVVLLDFGVVKLIDEQGPGLTAPSHVVGTPSCMAPEQIMGYPTGARTDIYALGALTYYMLTGELPFHDASVLMIQYMHLNTHPVKPSAIAPVGSAFDHVLLRAMSKHPDGRHASAMEFLADFRQAMEGTWGDDAGEPNERRMVAMHLEVQVEPEALEDPDEDLFGDMESILPFASRLLLPKGFTPAMMTGNTMLLVKELPGEPDREQATRREAVRTALALERQLAGRPRFDDRVRINLCLHVGTVQMAGGKLVDGELMQLSTWVLKEPAEGVVGSSRMFAGLEFATQPVAGGGEFLRVFDRPAT